LVARFALYDTSLAGGIANVVLFDQPGAGAPLTVQNFQNYVNNGDYVNSFIHRSVPGFVVQGGGFVVENSAISPITTNPPVQNEFSPERSNSRGTIAMAKLGGNPDSATSQWFFNLGDNNDPDNPNSLDNQNGGFTVFGELLSATDLAVVDAIADLTVIDATTIGSAFSNLPVITNPPSSDDDLVRYSSITITAVDELTFSVISNSNPSVVSATIVNNQLVLDYLPDQSGTAEIVVRATNLLGEFVDDTFLVTTTESPNDDSPILITPTSGSDQLVGTDSDDVIRPVRE